MHENLMRCPMQLWATMKDQHLNSKQWYKYHSINSSVLKMKGISPLIATVLLIAIVTLIAAILTNWSHIIILTETTESANKTKQVTGCENVEIENIYIDLRGDRVRVFMKSSGDTYANNVTLLNITGNEGYRITSLPFFLPKGELKRFEFTNYTLSSCSAFSRVIVTTECITEESTKVTGCT